MIIIAHDSDNGWREHVRKYCIEKQVYCGGRQKYSCILQLKLNTVVATRTVCKSSLQDIECGCRLQALDRDQTAASSLMRDVITVAIPESRVLSQGSSTVDTS